MSNTLLKTMARYFGTGTAEGEKAFLERAFLPLEGYLEILNVPPYAPRLIVGKKGSGKSALVRFIQYQMRESDLPTLLIRPKDVVIENISGLDSLGELTREYEAALLRAIAVKMGEDTSGFFADEASNDLIKLAQNDGMRDLDFIEKSLKLLQNIGKEVTDIDFTKMSAQSHNINARQIQNAVMTNLNKTGKVFYVFIDDTDQIASPNEPSHLNRIWAFLLASRSIMESNDNIKFFITLRNEVWGRLGRDQAGQRDQVDHFRNLVYSLFPTEDDIKRIISKRLKLVVKDQGLHDKGTGNYDYFFDGERVKIPDTNEVYRYWHDFLSKNSRNRPRDAVQLVSALIATASKKKAEKIVSADVVDVLPEYSEERVDDLQREVEDECSAIKELIRAFSFFEYDEGSFTMSAQGLIENLRTLPSRFRITVLGGVISDSDLHIFKLWQYLYEIGFLNARISDSRERDGYRHATVDTEPELVSKERWNDMQKMLWEVHPAYRSFLIQEQKNRAFSFGLPRKKKKR